MRIRSLIERVMAVCTANDIILDVSQGLTQVTPDVMMFYGVVKDKGLTCLGQGRQRRYLALIGQHIIIQPYEYTRQFPSTQ